MVSNNNIITVINNYIVAVSAVIKKIYYLTSNKAIPTIWYKITRFKSIYTKI